MDPVLLVSAAARTAIVLALLFVLPGLAWGPLIVPGAGSLLVTAGRAIGLSLLTTAITCTVLAWLGILQPLVVVVALAALIAVPVIVRWRSRASRPNHIGRSHLASRTRARRTSLLAGVAGAIAVAGVLINSRLEVGASLLPFTSTVWYYTNLAVHVASSGGIPASLPEWGTARAFQTDYLPVTAHTAAAIQLLPGDILVQMEIYRLAILAAAVVVAALLFRRWVSSWLAVLGGVLLVTTVRLDFKFLAYKPETFALILVMFVLWLTDRAMVERSRRLAVVAIAVGGLAFLSHAEVFLLLGPGVAGIVAARVFVGGSDRRVGLRPAARRDAVPVALAAAILIGSFVVGTAGNVAISGRLRILGYVAGGPAQVVPTPPADEIPPGWRFSNDPTWDFYVASVALGQIGKPPTSFFESRMLPRATLHIWPGLDARVKALLLVLGLLVLAPFVVWPALDPRRRRLVVTGIVFAGGLFVGSYALFVLSRTYVPERTGPRRLMPYEVVLPVTSLVVLLWGLSRLLRPGWRALLPHRGAGLAAATLLAILTLGAVAPASDRLIDDAAEPGLTVVGYDAYRWMADNLPADARILANAYTDGSIAAITGRVGIIDGRAVYLEDRPFLGESTALLLGARVVFGQPSGAGAAAFLARERVDYLVVAGPRATGADLGGYGPFTTDLTALQHDGRYTLVHTFGDGRVMLFRVGPAS
ncbi:MAG TPA: glycosyltransferase family 39 protein [Candidatus Acidoferrum sp.]|nr:glycosyltransferase family 39 protein [Candidatus Acidoferrum sp.]